MCETIILQIRDIDKEKYQYYYKYFTKNEILWQKCSTVRFQFGHLKEIRADPISQQVR